LERIFYIEDKDIDASESILLCEIGETYACFAECQLATNSIKRLEYYTFLPQQMEASFQQIIDTGYKQNKFSNVIICSGFTSSVLVPGKYYSPAANSAFFIEAANQQLLSDTISEWQLVNVYTLPKAVYRVFKDFSADTRFFHIHTPTLKMNNGVTAANGVSVHFSPHQFSVLVKREGHLLLAQMYSYNVPLDVVYYLLTIYEQLELPKTEMDLVLSGLIEENSALYTELNNYFLNIRFNTSSYLRMKPVEYPLHYFTSIHNLATCAL
jgi:hypothetical protein